MPTTREVFLTDANQAIDRLITVLDEGAPPDAAELNRLLRELRGTAQLAREARVQTVARAAEAASRELERGRLVWDDGLWADFRETADDLRALVAAEETEPEQDGRVTRATLRWEPRIGPAALDWAGPEQPDPGVSAGPAVEAGADFLEYLAVELDAIRQQLGAAVHALDRDAADREPLNAVLRRQRPLLGVARLEAFPAVVETLRSVEEIGHLASRLEVEVTEEWQEFLRAARDTLDAIRSTELEAAGEGQAGPAEEQPAEPPSLARLRQTRAALLDRHGSAGAADAPPPAEEIPIEVVNFFRSEALGLLERIERFARDLASETEEAAGRARREAHVALEALRDTARTFGFGRVADLADEAAGASSGAESADLLDRAAQLRAAVARPPDPAGAAAAPFGAGFDDDAAADAGGPGHNVDAPGYESREVDGPADVVPIEALCYRGDAALHRALELRPRLAEAIGEDPMARDVLDEVFDLIRLGLERSGNGS